MEVETLAAAACVSIFREINISKDMGAAVTLLTDPSAWSITFVHADFAKMRKILCTDGYGCLRMVRKLLPAGTRMCQIKDPNATAADKAQQLRQTITSMLARQEAAGIESKHIRLLCCDVSFYGDREGQCGFNQMFSGVVDLLLAAGATAEVIQVDHHTATTAQSSSQMEAFMETCAEGMRAITGFTVVTSDEVEAGLEPSSKTLQRIAKHAGVTDASDEAICYLSASTDNFLAHYIDAQQYLDASLGTVHAQENFLCAIHRMDACVQRSSQSQALVAAAHECGGEKGDYSALHPQVEALGGAVEDEVQGSVRTLKGEEGYELQRDYPRLFQQAFDPQNVMHIPRKGGADMKIAYFPHTADSFERAASRYVDDLCQLHGLDGVFLWKQGTPVGALRFNRVANPVTQGTVMEFVKSEDMEIPKGILSHFEPQGEPKVLGQPNLVVIPMPLNAAFKQCQLCGGHAHCVSPVAATRTSSNPY